MSPVWLLELDRQPENQPLLVYMVISVTLLNFFFLVISAEKLLWLKVLPESNEGFCCQFYVFTVKNEPSHLK